METPASRRERLTRYVLHRYWRVSRGMTMGVRAMVLDHEERVFLVRHTYVPGWHFPGGGVEPGETAEAAMLRELDEEAHIRPLESARLHGIFLNRNGTNRDHVLVYVVRAFAVEKPRLPDREIAEAGFFPVAALPDGTSGGTRRRLAEVLDEMPPRPFW